MKIEVFTIHQAKYKKRPFHYPQVETLQDILNGIEEKNIIHLVNQAFKSRAWNKAGSRLNNPQFKNTPSLITPEEAVESTKHIVNRSNVGSIGFLRKYRKAKKEKNSAAAAEYLKLLKLALDKEEQEEG